MNFHTVFCYLWAARSATFRLEEKKPCVLYMADDVVAPLAAPQSAIAVAELLP